MPSIEIVRVSSELVKPLAHKLLPRDAARVLRDMGVSLGQSSRAIQARLPEPVVICIKLALAWVLIPVIVAMFIFAPGVAKIMLGVICAAAATKAARRRRR